MTTPGGVPNLPQGALTLDNIRATLQDMSAAAMKSRAAVAFAAGKPLEIVEVDLEGPRAGEVLIEIKATGVCHTDAFTLSGDDPEGAFPAILGHEGAGVVEAVGPNVKTLAAGDHVVLTYGACGHCASCAGGHGAYCRQFFALNFGGAVPSGCQSF